MTLKIKQTIGRLTTIALIFVAISGLAIISSNSADRAVECQKQGKCIKFADKPLTVKAEEDNQLDINVTDEVQASIKCDSQSRNDCYNAVMMVNKDKLGTAKDVNVTNAMTKTAIVTKQSDSMLMLAGVVIAGFLAYTLMDKKL